MKEIIKNISKSKRISNNIYSLKPKGYWSNLSKIDNNKFLDNINKLGTKAAVKNLNKEFGYDKADELLQKSRQTIKQLDFEIIELIEHYKTLVEKLPN